MKLKKQLGILCFFFYQIKKGLPDPLGLKKKKRITERKKSSIEQFITIINKIQQDSLYSLPLHLFFTVQLQVIS